MPRKCLNRTIFVSSDLTINGFQMMAFSSVALLVDGDNISSTLAGKILRKAERLGPTHIRRVYGSQNAVINWSNAPSFRSIHVDSGKNGADILLSIEAMRFALRDKIEAFAIASSDRDFSHVAHALREMGHHVLGLGDENKAPDSFLKACSEYEKLSMATGSESPN